MAFPFVFVIVASMAFGGATGGDGKLVIAVVNSAGEGPASQLISTLRESSKLEVKELPYDEALTAVRKGELPGFLHFTAGFNTAASGAGKGEIEVIANPQSQNTRQALLSIASSISMSMSRLSAVVEEGMALATKKGANPLLLPAAIGSLIPGAVRGEEPASQIVLREEKVGEIAPKSAASWTLPGYLVMFVFFAASMGAKEICRERENMTLERLVSATADRYSIVFGKFLAACLRGVLQVTVMWLVGLFLFRIDWGRSPVSVLLASFLMILASAGFSVMLAALARTTRSADSLGVLFSLTFAALGGSWWPLFVMPRWMQMLSRVTPHSWANSAFNKLMLFGAALPDVQGEILGLVVFAAVFLTVAVWRFRVSD